MFNFAVMQKILVIQTAFIGDVVLATALLEKLHGQYPNLAIDILVRKGNESLFQGHPFIHKVVIWDKKKHKYRNLIDLLHLLRDTRYDKIFNLQRFAATGIITLLSGAGETIGFDKNPFSFGFTRKIAHQLADSGQSIHEVNRNQQLISHLTDDVALKPKLYPTAADFDFVQQWKEKPYICIAPASVWVTKQFPAEQWVAFLNLVTAHITVYLIGGPGDKDLCEKIKVATTNSEVVNLAGQLGFLQSAALIKDAIMNYVNDSAPMHFASAMDAPVAAIYCSTVPSFGFGPLSTQSYIIEVHEQLACRPCGLHGKAACPLGHFNCARLIHAQQLLSVLPLAKQ